MKIDLHMHTKYSDGELDEYQIIDEVIEAGVKEFCICDHDTITGSEKVYNLLKKSNSNNLIFHSGVELSCKLINQKYNINIHMLVRDFEYDDKDLNKLLETMKQNRLKKIDIMLNRVKEVYDIEIPKEKVLELLKYTNTIGKPHIYKLLSEYGNFDKEEFYKNLKHLKTEHLKLDAFEVLEKMTKGNSYVTLAHPKEIMEDHNLTYDDIEEIIKILKSYGLKALETKHSLHTKKDYEVFHNLAEKYNLLETCGSDYHGANVKPDVKIGEYEKAL